MKKFINKTVTFLKKSSQYSLLLCIILFAVFTPFEVFANSESIAAAMLTEKISTLSKLQDLMVWLIWQIAGGVGLFMDSRFILEGEMGEVLYRIWVEMRDIMNLFFIVILVVIAIANVFGFGKDSDYAVKSILPRIIIAAIVVNLTYGAARIALNFVDGLTMTSFAIADIEKDDMGLAKMSAEHKFCRDHAIRLNNEDIDSEEKLVKFNKQCIKSPILFDAYPHIKGFNKTSSIRKKLFPDITLSPFFYPSTGGVSYFKFTKNASFSPDLGEETTSISKNNFIFIIVGNLTQVFEYRNASRSRSSSMAIFFANTLVNVVLTSVLAAALVSLFVILIVRIVVLWLGIALSPFIAIIIIFKNFSGGGSGLDPKKHIIENLFAPLKIGFIFSIAFTMLNSIYIWLGSALDNVGDRDAIIMHVMNNRNCSLENAESAGNCTGAGMFAAERLNGSALKGFDEIFMFSAVIIIIYMGVKNVSPGLTKTFTDSIMDIPKKTAGIGLTVAKNLPIFPLLSGKPASLSGLQSRFNVNNINQNLNNRGRYFNGQNNPAQVQQLMNRAAPVQALQQQIQNIPAAANPNAANGGIQNVFGNQANKAMLLGGLLATNQNNQALRHDAQDVIIKALGRLNIQGHSLNKTMASGAFNTELHTVLTAPANAAKLQGVQGFKNFADNVANNRNKEEANIVRIFEASSLQGVPNNVDIIAIKNIKAQATSDQVKRQAIIAEIQRNNTVTPTDATNIANQIVP